MTNNRVVIASDLHLHNWSEFSKIDPKTETNTRLNDGINVLHQIRKYMFDNRIKLFLFLGDLLHKGEQIETSLLDELISVLHRMREDFIFSIFVVGNHDQASRDGMINAVAPFWDYVYPAQKEEVLDVHSMTPFRLTKELALTVCPYRRGLAEQKKALEWFSKQPKDDYNPFEVNLFLGHFYCQELIQGDPAAVGIEAVSFSDLPKGCDYYFLGDYHKPVLREDLKLESLGAVMHHSFSDVGRPQGVFLDFNLDTLEKKYIPVESPMFVDIGPEDKFPVKGHDPKDFYRVRVGSKKERDKIVSKMGDQEWNVRFVYEQEEEAQPAEQRMDIDVTTDPAEVISKYVAHVNGDQRLIPVGHELYRSVEKEACHA